MPSLNQMETANAAYKPTIQNAVGVFFGGTSGIGKETAYLFAKKFERPTVIIVGRSEEAGSKIVADLSSQANVTFIKSDLSQMKEVVRVSDLVKKDVNKINLLFLSQGILSTAGRTETSEGIELRMSLNYYGRWLAVRNLLPLVQNAYNEGDKENARVVSVLGPGNEGKYEEGDMQLRKKFTLANQNRHITEFTSAAAMRFARLHPDLSFIHASPGYVATGITRELPWYVRYPSAVLLKTPWAVTAEQSGEKFFYMGVSCPKFAHGAFLMDANAESVKDKAVAKGYLTEKDQDKIWKHTEEEFDLALKK
ncbi:putative oxidoreductase bli-4 [Yarrowia sp. B02]|nr:putative oxidoreductase bli-4 [Yarrowia sp. B02]